MDSIITFGAKYLFVAVPLIFLLALYQAGRSDRKKLIAAVVLAVIIAAILDKLGSKFYYDPRPFTTHSFKPLITHAADNGFPSEHTLFSMTIAAVIFAYRRRLGATTVLIALLVGIARVAAKVHSPIDIIGAIVMAALAAYLGVWAAGKIQQSRRRGA